MNREIIYFEKVLDYIILNERRIIDEDQYYQRMIESDEILFYPNTSAYAGIVVGTGFDCFTSDKITPFFKIDYSRFYLYVAIKSVENIKFALGIKI
ncbi:MAG: hypothetical protein PF485_09035 [Bacteroidales bacterium]|nr:hypothetical protein [Bacteroidales bacterium]